MDNRLYFDEEISNGLHNLEMYHDEMATFYVRSNAFKLHVARKAMRYDCTVYSPQGHIIREFVLVGMDIHFEDNLQINTKIAVMTWEIQQLELMLAMK